jgi:hypothetical protein
VLKLLVSKALMNAAQRAADSGINPFGHFQAMIDLKCDSTAPV